MNARTTINNLLYSRSNDKFIVTHSDYFTGFLRLIVKCRRTWPRMAGSYIHFSMLFSDLSGLLQIKCGIIM